MTGEQRAALVTFRAIFDPLRLRVRADEEGWPTAPGRYGRIEWHTETVVAISSQTMRMLAKLTSLPGVRRHQIGDDEFRLLLPVVEIHDRAVLVAAAKLLRVRTRRVESERSKLALLHGQRRFQPREATAP